MLDHINKKYYSLQSIINYNLYKVPSETSSQIDQLKTQFWTSDRESTVRSTPSGRSPPRFTVHARFLARYSCRSAGHRPVICTCSARILARGDRFRPVTHEFWRAAAGRPARTKIDASQPAAPQRRFAKKNLEPKEMSSQSTTSR